MPETDKTFIHTSQNQIAKFFFDRSKTEIFIGLIATLITAYMFKDQFSQQFLTIWTISAIVLYLARLTSIVSKINAIRSFLFLLILLLNGVLWGTAGYTSVMQESVPHMAGLLTTIVCLCFLVALIYPGNLGYFLAFTLPALTLPGLVLVNQPGSVNQVALYLVTGTGIFLFLLSLLSRKTFQCLIRRQAEYDQLQDQHDTLLEEIRKKEVEFKSLLQKNEEMENALKQATENLKQKETRNKALADTLKTNLRIDPVTSLPNRREFLETVQEEWQRATRNKEPLTIAFINVDEFETISKQKDKKTVFTTLKKIGESIRNHGRRAGDLPARIDKAGFALLLLGADSKNATRIIEKIRETVKSLSLPVKENGEPVSVHAGVATLVPNRKLKPETFLERVESATFEAGFKGGDTVVSYHAFHDIEVTLWDSINDGELNEANFQQKLLSRGFDTTRQSIPPQTYFRDQIFTKPTLFAVYSGIFLLNIEGQAYELKNGSSLILPPDVTFSAEVVGDEPVVLYLEKR